MNTLQARQEKIQAKRKQTPWREFVREIASWMPFNLYKNNGLITPYSPQLSVIKGVVTPALFDEQRNDIEIIYTGNLFESLQSALSKNCLAGTKVVGQNENSDYSYIILGAKNSYLSIVVVDSENVLYTYNSFFSKDVYNSILIQHSAQVFSSRIVSNSYAIFYSSNVDESNNLRFCANMNGCTECVCCRGLSHQSYCIDNISYAKEDYYKKKRELLSEKKIFDEYTNYAFSHPGANIGADITGSFNKLCDSIESGFMNYQLAHARNVVFCNGTDIVEHVSDCCSIGGTQSDHIYASMGVGFGCHHVYCSVECSPYCSHLYYCYLLDSCSFCLGCIGLKNKSYCIFNKQYSKEEWTDKVNEIFAKMDEQGILGDFFPASMNPFYFNDTAAYLIDSSFTKEEITKLGYLWRDEAIRVDIPEGAIIVKSSELGVFESWIDPPDPLAKGEQIPHNSPLHSLHETLIKGDEAKNQWKLDETVCKRVILDENGDAYRIIPMELEFLQKHGLPLPRKHWLTRMKENFRIN